MDRRNRLSFDKLAKRWNLAVGTFGQRNANGA
jgi:hypothetical protein